MKKCILCGAEGDTYFCEKCGGRMEDPSSSEKTMYKNIYEMEKKNYLNIVFIFLAIIVVVKLVSVGEFLWQIATLAVVVKTVDIYMSHKGKVLPGHKMEEWKKRLICLSVSFLLLFALDSYYRESKNPYMETDVESHIVAESEEKMMAGNGVVTIYDTKNLKLGDYYKICYMNGANGWNIFRIPKENQIKYGTPSVSKNEYGYEVTIKREGMDDLVYVMPY